MKHDRFVYVTYIRTTPEKVWEAMTSPAFTRKYLDGELAGLRLDRRLVVEVDVLGRPGRRRR